MNQIFMKLFRLAEPKLNTNITLNHTPPTTTTTTTKNCSEGSKLSGRLRFYMYTSLRPRNGPPTLLSTLPYPPTHLTLSPHLKSYQAEHFWLKSCFKLNPIKPGLGGSLLAHPLQSQWGSGSSIGPQVVRKRFDLLRKGANMQRIGYKSQKLNEISGFQDLKNW